MNNIIVLGAGMVGSAIAIDLSKKHNVTLPQDIIDNINLRFKWVNGLAFGGEENIPQHQRPPS